MMPLSSNPQFLQILDMRFKAGFLELEGSLVGNVLSRTFQGLNFGIQRFEIFGVVVQESFQMISDMRSNIRKPKFLGIQEPHENFGIASKNEPEGKIRQQSGIFSVIVQNESEIKYNLFQILHSIGNHIDFLRNFSDLNRVDSGFFKVDCNQSLKCIDRLVQCDFFQSYPMDQINDVLCRCRYSLLRWC